MFPKKVSDVIKRLEDLKTTYGDLRVMVHTTGGSKDFVEDIFITNHVTSAGVEHVVYLSN